MARKKYIVDLNFRKIPLSVGNKAFNLKRLQRSGIRIPRTFVCDWEAYHAYLANDLSLIEVLRNELRLNLSPDKYYAVRSSANIEDGRDRSFAGQFKSVLNAQGVDQIFQAIWAIWGTANSPGVQSYLERRGVPKRQLSMAVIIQEMIQPLIAGVAFSRNPVTGADETIVEAVRGLGDALVQAGVTPYRWVNKANHWLVRPDNEDIPLTVVEEVVTQTRKIARDFKSRVDLEWVWDGEKIYWLQVREITTLGQRNLYSNYMSKEMLPGMIKPLVWSVNIPMKSNVFVRFLNEMMGETGIKPEALIRAFYYRVYFNMGVLGLAFSELGLPADSVEMMAGLVPMDKMAMKPTFQMILRLPHFMAFAHDKWMFHRKMRRFLPDLDRKIKSINWQDALHMSIPELFAAIDQLYPLVQEVAYYNIVCPILSVMHKRMLDRELERFGVEPSHFDVSEGLFELDEYKPTVHLHRLSAIFERIDPRLQENIRAATYEQFKQMPGIDVFQKGVADFIDRFGHLSDNGNDFSCTPWREDTDLVLRLILDFKLAPADKEQKVRFIDLKINPLRRPIVKLFYERVRAYYLLREQLSSRYTFTYGLFRNYYLALSRHLVMQGIIETTHDIFFLTHVEVRQLALGNSLGYDHRAVIAQHKIEMEKFRDIALPGVIYGDKAPPVAAQASEKLCGLATSFGYHTGVVKVVRGLQDFGKVQGGDVLVIPYSDVGWSPLFAHAGAVVAESGGLLSHSSIIAREYNIPAVVSVEGATRLADETLVTVDGHKGEVYVHPKQ